MPSDRAQFLALAALSQSVVEALLAFIEEDDWEKMNNRLRDIIHPLEAAVGIAPSVPGSRRPFSNYEQLRTVAAVWKPAERQTVVRTLKALLKHGNTEGSKGEARSLIDPFQKLSTQALWNFDQPSTNVPRGVMDLCKVP